MHARPALFKQDKSFPVGGGDFMGLVYIPFVPDKLSLFRFELGFPVWKKTLLQVEPCLPVSLATSSR